MSFSCHGAFRFNSSEKLLKYGFIASLKIRSGILEGVLSIYFEAVEIVNFSPDSLRYCKPRRFPCPHMHTSTWIC